LCVIDPVIIDSRGGRFDITPQKLAEKVNCLLQVMAQSGKVMQNPVLVAGVSVLELSPS
jgi:hypothetical protein